MVKDSKNMIFPLYNENNHVNKLKIGSISSNIFLKNNCH